MKNFSFLIVLAFLFIAGTTISQTVYTVSGSASGAQEVPPNGSTGTATFSGQYDQATSMITLNIPFSGLATPTLSAHIHNGAAGTNGGVVVPLTIATNVTSGVITGSYAIDPVLYETALINGDTYVNIHTVMQTGGEIRGQLILTAPTVPTLGEWGIIVLGLLIVTIGVVYIYQREPKLVRVRADK